MFGWLHNPAPLGHGLGAALILGSAAMSQQSAAGDYATEQAIRAELRTILDGAIRQHAGQEIKVTKAWGYLHPDKSVLFCGAGYADYRLTTFVVFMDGADEDVVDVGTPLDVMRDVGCGSAGFQTIQGAPPTSQPLTGINPDPLPSLPQDSSHIPKDVYGNILVTAEDRTDPRCSVGASYAYRIFAEHERDVIPRSGEPIANFNDYSQPFGRCFNRMGQALMQGLLSRAQAASDRLWLENEIASLRLRYGRR